MKFFDASRYASPLRKALDKKENAPRNLRFETLENRALLSVTPLDELQAAVASAEIAPAQTVETPVVDLSVLAVSNATLESNADDQYEGENGNNTAITATQLGTLTQTTTLEAIAGSNREQDWYRVNFKYAGTADAYLRLEAPEGVLLSDFFLALKSNSGDTLAGRTGQIVDGAKVVSLAGLSAGEYTVQVYYSGKAADNTYSLSSAYTLTIEPPKPEADDRYENVADGVDNNDSFTNAYDLDMVGDLKLEAKAGPNHNPDYFKFTMVGTGTAQDQIKLSAAANAYLNFRLYSANDTQTPISEEMTSEGSAVLSLKDLAAGDYYVFVDNNLTADSFVKYSLTFNAPKVAPAAPTNFKATENVSKETSHITKNETTLAWDAVENATYYEIRYTTDVDANPTWSDVEKVEDLSQAVSLAYGTSYKYQVRAVTVYNDNLSGDAAVEGAWTDLEFVTVSVPEAPAIKTDDYVLDPTTHSVTLAWYDVKDEDGYVVEQYVDGQWVAASETLPAGANSWTSGELEYATTYTYRVVAVNAVGRGVSEEITFTTQKPVEAPAELTVAVDPATHVPTLTWSKVDNALGYIISRSADGEHWGVELLNIRNSNTTSYTLDNYPTLSGQTTYYRVLAYNAYGEAEIVSSVTLEAASTIVTTTDDVLDPFDNKTSLREAINNASYFAAVPGSTITFAEELRGETFSLTSQLEIKKSVSIEGLVDETGAPAIAVSGDNNFRVFNVNGAGVDQTLVKLSNLTVTGGFVSPPYGQYAHGAGVSVERAKATFDNVAFYQNSYSLQSDSHTSVSYASVKGTALYAGENAEVIVANSAFVENVAFNGYGAAHIDKDAKATFENVKMTGNQGGFGGALHIAGEATLTNVEMSGNYSNGNAGALYVASAGSATVTNAKITGNTASGSGGALYMNGGAATFTNVQITGNTSTTNGSAVHATGNSAATFTNVTIADNTVLQGDGNTQYRASVYVPVTSVDAVPSVSFRNSIIVGGEVIEYNTTGVHLPTQPLTVVNTVTSYDYLANLSGTGNIYYDDEAAVPAPLFADAANGDYRLAVDSVARDKGLDSWLYDEAGKPIVATDLAGNTRFNHAVDMGALENQTPDAPTNFKTNGDEATWNKTTLSWNDVDLETSYELQVSTDGGQTWTPAGTTEADVTTFELADLNYGTAYQYQLRAVHADGASAWVNLEFSTVAVPEAPTNLAVSKLDPETRKVTFTWSKVDDANEYVVLLSTADGQTQVKLPAGTTSWAPDVEFALGSSGSISITPVNNAGVGGEAVLNFTVEDVPAQPIDLTATVDDALYATLAWTADADATPATGYEVAIIDEKGECQVVATLKADATKWTTAAPLAHGAIYAYAVRAVNEYGLSTWIAVEFATPEAASTVVTTAEDVVDAYDGEISLREAIQYAEAGDTITFADDVATITLAGTQLEITKALTIDGGENGVTVDADGKSRVFYLDAANGTVALTNLTITDGSTSYVDLGGAGVYVNGAATFTNVTIAENNAQYGEGAGVYVNGAATFTNVTIAGNNAIYGNFGGGGVYVNNGGSATFTDSKISENSNDFRGGAVYLGKAATVAFTDSEISGNTAEGDGGGLYVSSDATVAFTDSKISENIVTYRDGGGVCVCSGATAIFTNVEISDNAATYNGSAVNVANGGAATFANVTITGNTSKYGAALDISGTATLTNVTIAGNTAQYQVANFKGTATFTNVTIAGNTGAQTLYNDGTVNFYNSILVGNSSNALTNAGTANAYNTLSNFTKWTNADEEGVANYVYDETQPLFADGSYTLAAGSQAINKGNDAYLADEITTDLAGNPRFNGAVDLGAYESQIPNAPVLTVPELTVETFVPGEQTVALTWTNVDFETGYVVETLVDGAWVAASELLDAGTTTWTTGKLELGATYSFRVVAKNDEGDGVSAEVTFKTPNVPAKPKLSATVNESSTPTVTLNWTNVEGETGYRIEIQAEDETGTYVWTTLAKLDADVDNYTINVQRGQTYYYRVVALNAYGETVSDHERVAVGDVPTEVPKITEVKVNAAAQPTATISWRSSLDVSDYRLQIYRVNGDDLGETLVYDDTATFFMNFGDNVYTVPALNADGEQIFELGQDYVCRVYAVNAYGVAETPDEYAFSVGDVPTAPTNLGYTQHTSQLRFSWTDVATDETGYRVEYRVAGTEEWTEAPALNANAKSYALKEFERGVNYEFRVRAENEFGASEWVQATATTLTAPTEVAFGEYAADLARLPLSWDAVENAEVYRVEVSTTPFKSEAVTPASQAHQIIVVQNGKTSCVISNVEPDQTYYVRVKAYEANASSSSSWSESINFSAPLAPTNLGYTQYTSQLNFRWTDVSNSETGYRVEYRVAGTEEWTEAPALNANAKSYALKEFERGVNYEFRVRAENEFGVSEWVQATATTLTAPTGVAFGEYAADLDRLPLSWNAVENAEVYRVEVSTTPFESDALTPTSQAHQIVVVQNGKTSCVISNVESGQTYYVRVRAYEANGSSGSSWSGAVNFDAPTPASAPTAPTNLDYTQSSSQLNFRWTDVATDETGYRFEYRVAGTEEWTEAPALNANAKSYVLNEFERGVNYEFRVRAENEFGVSEWVQATATTLTAPTGVAFGEYAADLDRLPLSWNAVENAEVYRVEVSTTPFESDALTPTSQAHQIVVVQNGKTSCVISNVEPGQTYYVRVRAYEANGSSGSSWSGAVNFDAPTPASAPTAPTNLGYTQYTSQLNFRWTDVATDETGYRVEYRVAGTEEWTEAPALNANAKSYVLNEFERGVNYEFRVRAENEFGASEWVQATATTLTAPTGVAFGEYVADLDRLPVSWDAVENAEVYRVEVSTTPFESATVTPTSQAHQIIVVQNGQTSCVISNVEPGQTYYVRVKAYEANCSSGSSWSESGNFTPATPASAAFADAFDELDFFVDEDELDALAKRLI